MMPFGFELTSRGVLVVSEAATGLMSSYALGDARLAAISSASISSYDISSVGALTLRDERAAMHASISSYDGTALDLSAVGCLRRPRATSELYGNSLRG